MSINLGRNTTEIFLLVNLQSAYFHCQIIILLQIILITDVVIYIINFNSECILLLVVFTDDVSSPCSQK